MTLNYNEKYTQITAQLVAALRSKVTAFTYLSAAYNIADRTERIRLVDAITRDYIAEHAEYNQRALDAWERRGCKGERPRTVSADTAMLERLANAILNEELTGQDSAKATREEYPFLSDTQLARRRDGVHVREGGGVRGEMSISAAGNLGTDGRDYREPTRRWRTPEENAFMDRTVKSRNRKRAAQYRRDTAAGRLVTYNLNDTGGELAPEFEACKGVGERWKNELSLVYT